MDNIKHYFPDFMFPYFVKECPQIIYTDVSGVNGYNKWATYSQMIKYMYIFNYIWNLNVYNLYIDRQWKSNKNVTAVENLEKGIFSYFYYSCKFSEYLKLFQNKCWQPPEDWRIWLVDFKDSGSQTASPPI